MLRRSPEKEHENAMSHAVDNGAACDTRHACQIGIVTAPKPTRSVLELFMGCAWAL